jgi:hypothetical protein
VEWLNQANYHINYLTFVVVITVKSYSLSRVQVAHTYNPSYSGGKDQEDPGQPRQTVGETLSQKDW